jgi:ABC-type transport system involved in multi-copper enzyme maturation permease subunit
MLGPVLAQELLLGSRRSRQHLFRRIYTGWLAAQLLFFYFLYLVNANVIGSRIFGGAINPYAASDFATSFVGKLVYQQLLLLLLATPAFTAGAITDEKASGTLQYLLAADLTSWEIVLGKLLGRTAQVAVLALAALPLLCFIGIFGGLNLILVIALLAVSVAPMFALGAASLLASVWSRQTRDAVLGVYFVGAVAYLVLWCLGWLAPFDPLYVLEPAWGENPDVKDLAGRLFVSVLAWGSIGALCLGLATWRLRSVYLKQLEGEGRPKKLRWWRARRGAISDEPVRWKERHVEGVAPLAVLRRVPRWVGLAFVFAATSLASLTIIVANLQGSAGVSEALALIINLKFSQLSVPPGALSDYFVWQGLVALFLATLVVGVRCSGAVTGERERQTWEALLMTPLPSPQLIRGKLRGIIGASYPYLLAYAVPALFFSIWGSLLQASPAPFLWTLLLLGVTWLAMAFVGAAGLWCSVRSKSSWRSLLGTVLIGYVGGFMLYGVALPVAGIVYGVVYLTLLLVDLAMGHNPNTGLASLFSRAGGAYVVATCLALIGGFLLAIKLFLVTAQQYVALRERVRHWKEEPRIYTRRRPRRQPLASDNPK